MRFKFLVLLSLLPMAAANAVPLSWEQCVQRAVQENADLQSATEKFHAVELDELGASSGFLPKISANLSGTRAREELDGGGASEGSSYGANLVFAQNLFACFLDSGKRSQAKANTQAAEATLQIAKAKLSYELKAAFQALLYSNRYTALTRDILRRRKDNLGLVELRFKSGRENKGSVLLSRAYLEQAKLDDLQALNDVVSSRAELAKALGLDEPETLDISGTIPVTDPSGTTPPFEQLVTATPEHRQALAEEKSAASELTIARSQFFPTLQLNGSVGETDDHFFPSRDRWSVGATLSLPLFDGLKDYGTSRSASALARASISSRQSVSRQELTRLKQIFSTYVESVVKYQVDASFREAAVLRAEIGRSKYNTGLLTFDQWDLIETDLIAREKAYLQSQRDRVINEAAWEQAQGKGVIP